MVGMDGSGPQAHDSETDLTGAPQSQEVLQWQAAHAALLAAYIELIKGQDGLIPEMVAGSSLADVQASVGLARQAYGRLAAQLARATAGSEVVMPTPVAEGVAGPPPFVMGAGGGSRASGLSGGLEQQQGKRPDPVALIAQYYSSGTPRR